MGATLFAIPILNQVPGPIQLVGGALVLVGIYFTARQESRSPGIQTTDAAVEL
jgi:drug/metabolite transporter (DMT)-like permease